MFKRSAARAVTILATMLALTVMATSRALAMRPDPPDPVNGPVSRTPVPPIDNVVNWPLVIVAVVVAIAVVGLFLSLATRRRQRLQHA